jgi:hypothetical protein
MTGRPAPPSLLTRAESAYEWLRQHADVVDGESSFQLLVTDWSDGEVPCKGLEIVGEWDGNSVGYQTDTLYGGELPLSTNGRVTHMLETAVDKIRRNGWAT